MAGGLLNVVSNAELDAKDAEQAAIAADEQKKYKETSKESLSGYVTDKYYDFRKIHETRGISDRMIESLRTFNGEYNPSKLQEIQKFGGSEVFARTTATKCRGATAMLRDIYLGAERPWYMDHTPVPEVPGEIESSILKLVMSEVQNYATTGQPLDPQQIEDRLNQLRKSAEQASLKKAKDEAKNTNRQIEDVLVEGGFYDALAEVLLDLTVFPYAVMQGPVVEMANTVEWDVNGQAVAKQKPKMFWKRTSPFDLYWASGVEKFEDADVIEHVKFAPHQLMDLKDLPGYDSKAIDKVIEQYGQGGLNEWLDETSTEEAQLEDREDPYNNDSNMIDSLKWHGKIQGKLLKEWEFPETAGKENEFFTVIAWVVGDQVIKCQLDPNPRQRHNYYMTSFEKIPGATIGHGIPELINDIQSVMNATLRALVNNLSISSGPQVTVYLNKLSETTNPNDMYPWKKWFVEEDPLDNNNRPAVDFWQPNSNAQELLMVFGQMSNLADEVSTIPKYMTGSEKVGGAGRTASGLSMLMGASSKVLQSVAGNVDNDIIGPALTQLHEMMMLTSPPGTFRGDENVRVRGVNFSVQKETERMRSLEFLQMTANPIDMGIIGTDGRAEVLRKVADALGMDHASIVPDENTLAAQAQQAATPGAPGATAPMGLPPGQMPNEAAGQVDQPIQNMVPTG